jgi:hypothetical protein
MPYWRLTPTLPEEGPVHPVAALYYVTLTCRRPCGLDSGHGTGEPLRGFVSAFLCVAVAGLLAVQFPGFWSFDLVPSELDVTAIEVANRVWAFTTPGAVAGINPLAYLGTPVWALPVSGLAFPTTWLGVVLPWHVALLLAWFVQACLFVVGWFWALRAVGVGWPGSVLPGVLLFVSGPVWSFHAVGLMDFASISLSGWLVLAVRSWCASTTAAAAARIGAILALTFMAGDPLMVPISVFIAVVVCWRDRPAPRAILSGVVAAGAMAAGLSAPLLAEARAFFPLSERAAPFGLSLYEKLAFSTPPARFLETISSFFRFNPEEIRRVNQGAMNTDDFWYPTLTLGVVVLVFVAIGIRDAVRKRNSMIGLVVLAGVLVFLSLGRWSPAAAWVWENVPPLSAWRFPERLWRPTLVAVLPLLAVGLDSVTTYRGVRVAWCIGLIGVVELLSQTPSPAMMEVPLPPPEFAALREAASHHDVRMAVDTRTNKAARLLRFDVRLHGLPMVRPPDSVSSPILKFLPSEILPNHFGLQWLGVSHIFMPGNEVKEIDASLQLASTVTLGDTGFVLRRVSDSGPRLGLLVPRASTGVPLTRVAFDNPNVVSPEGAVVLSPPAVDPSPLIHALEDERIFVDDRWHLVEGILNEGLPSSLPAVASSCEVTTTPLAVTANAARITAHPSSSCPTILSLPWRFVQGWRATIDGESVPIVAINSLTLGVFVPPGDHGVVLSFHPPGEAVLPLAAGSLVVLAILQLQAIFRARRGLSVTAEIRRELTVGPESGDR